MNTSQMQHLENILSSDKLSKSYLAYFRESQKNHVYEQVLELFLEKAQLGFTKKDLAQKLGKNAAQITRWLSGPGNWTLDTISDLLLAMGAEIQFRTVELGSGPIPNYEHPVVSFVRDPFIDPDYLPTHIDANLPPPKPDITIAA